MGLIKCPDCGNMVSERAGACPSCGCPAEFFVTRDEEDRQMTFVLLTFHLLKCLDRKDLVLAGDAVTDDLRRRLTADYPVTFIGSTNIDEHLVKIQNKDFSFPYIFVTANFRYMLDYRNFTLLRGDGSTYQRYYNLETLPSEYGPVINIFAESTEQLADLTNRIRALLSERKDYSVPFLGSENEFLTFSNKAGSISLVNTLVDGEKTKLFHRTVSLEQSPWATFIGSANTPPQLDGIRNIRALQLAQFSLIYAATKDECDKELELYTRLLEGTIPRDTELTGDFKAIQFHLALGNTITTDLVEKAFPNITLIYHSFPNDLVKRSSPEYVKDQVNGTLEMYEKTWSTVCDALDLPGELDIPNWNYSGYNNNMRSSDGLTFLINSLLENHTAQIKDLINDYAQMLASLGEEGYIESEQRYEEFMDMLHAGSERRREFTRGVLRTAAGVVLGNKISDKLKKKD